MELLYYRYRFRQNINPKDKTKPQLDCSETSHLLLQSRISAPGFEHKHPPSSQPVPAGSGRGAPRPSVPLKKRSASPYSSSSAKPQRRSGLSAASSPPASAQPGPAAARLLPAPGSPGPGLASQGGGASLLGLSVSPSTDTSSRPEPSAAAILGLRCGGHVPTSRPLRPGSSGPARPKWPPPRGT